MSELRDRAAGREVAQNNTDTSLSTLIRKMEPQFAMAMPKGVEAAQIVPRRPDPAAGNPEAGRLPSRHRAGRPHDLRPAGAAARRYSARPT